MIALKDLHPARGTIYDVRKAGNGDITELKASIKSIGILIPLAVKKADDARLIVVAGNRRLAALKELYPPDYKVPTVSADAFSGDTRVLAMATNIALPQHPMDRYEIIAALVKEGMTPAEAQERFALSDKVFRQTMRLGALSPKIRDAYRDGEIDGDTARAFALTDDARTQEKLFGQLKKSSHMGRFNAHAVTSKLGGSTEVGKLVTFVGVETVAAAGILKIEDLFGSNHDVTDAGKLHKMAQDRINAEIGVLTTAGTPSGGWGWAAHEEDLGQDRYYYGRENPASTGKPTAEEKAELAKIVDALSNAPEDEDDWSAEQHDMHWRHGYLETLIKNRGYTAEQKARSGCILAIDYNGNLKIDYARTKPRAPSKTVSPGKEAGSAKKDVAKKPGEVAVISNKLAERMSTSLQNAVAAALEHDPRLAAAAMIAAFASGGHVLNVRAGGGSTGTAEDFVGVFEGTKNASANELLSMLMKVAQQAVNIVTQNSLRVPIEDEALSALLAAMKPSVVNSKIVAHFDYTDYFNSVSVAGISDAVRTAQGDKPADTVAKMAKKNAVDYAVQHVPATNWLPKEMRSVHYDGPVEPAPAPKKTAAKKASAPKKPAKKAAKKVAKKKTK
jgi:ParB family chromosome partitioning protein